MIEGHKGRLIKYGNVIAYRTPPQLYRDSQYPHHLGQDMEIIVNVEMGSVTFIPKENLEQFEKGESEIEKIQTKPKQKKPKTNKKKLEKKKNVR